MDNKIENSTPTFRHEYAPKRDRPQLSIRPIINFAMGILYIAVGLFMMFPEAVGFEMEGFDKVFRYMFGGLCLLYGAWRIYRGLKKDYI